MKANELKRRLETIPDDAEVTYKLYPLTQIVGELKRVTLAFSLGPDLYEIPIDKEYPGLPK